MRVHIHKHIHLHPNMQKSAEKRLTSTAEADPPSRMTSRLSLKGFVLSALVLLAAFVAMCSATIGEVAVGVTGGVASAEV